MDEPVSLGISLPGEEPEWLLNLPQRIFTRLQLLASAYELHVLPNIDPNTESRLNQERCRSLHDELCFVADQSSDGLVRTAIASALVVVDRAMGIAHPVEVVVEGP